MGRYSRRRQTLDGSYGKLADAAGITALVARNRACDSQDLDRPNWSAGVRRMLELSFANVHTGFDVRSPYDPHAYGTSLRKLWNDAKRRGASDNDAWQAAVTWARHRPAVWDLEDRRRKKGQVHDSPILADFLSAAIIWQPTGNIDEPWQCEWDGKAARIRLNDFPDEILYSLVIDNTVFGSFHDWPESWHR
jgi:hypothetical protein